MSPEATIAFNNYPQYEKLVYSAIYAVYWEIGGDIREMTACAGWLFAKACRTYKPGAGRKIESWIRKVTWDDTYAARRIDLGRRKKYEKGDIDLLAIADKPHFSLEEFVANLSEDARNLVFLALNPSDGIKLCNDGTPKKNSFFVVAKQVYNWSDEQLQEIVKEIQECL